MKNIITIKGLTFISTIILCFSFATVKQFQATKVASKSHLVDQEEAGEHIEINGTLIDDETDRPLANTEIFFFQANSSGLYEPKVSNDERTARISGFVKTDEKGRFTVYTIMPGNYPNAPAGRAHIHSEITHYNNVRIVKDILFDHDVSEDVRNWAKETGNGIIIELDDVNGEKVGKLELRI